MKKLITFMMCLLFLLTSAVPALAYSDHAGFGAYGNLVDLTDVLSDPEEEYLEQEIAEISDFYRCGVYVIVDRYTDYAESPEDAVINLYHGQQMGIGSDRDGILLLLDTVNRKFAFFVYGDTAEYIFNAYGQDLLEDVFLDDFGNNDWYGGLEDFVMECGSYMELAAQGNPVSESKTGMYVAVVVGSLLIAFVVCFVLVRQMKSVVRGAEASAYVVSGGQELTKRNDVFTHMTRVTQDLSQDDSGGGSSHSFSGGGGSGRSGSF